MRKKIITVLAVVSALCALSQTALAGLAVKEIKWQVVSAAEKPGGKASYQDAASLTLGKNGKFPGKVRLLVRVENSGAQAAEGRVFRCAVSMRIAKDGASEPGLWSVPFTVDERRVGKIQPGETADVIIAHLDLNVYLKRIANTGFTPDRLAASVMAEPRKGDELAALLSRSEIELKAK